MPDDKSGKPTQSAPRCAVCGKPQNPDFQPFCSKRCRQIDLGRWLGGRYRIETDEKPETGVPPEVPEDD